MQAKYIAIILLLPFLLSYASAATYYLDANTGNDNYAGTAEQPWKTLAKAISIVTGGDIIKLRNGNYGGLDLVNKSYTSWVTFQADTGATPIVTGVGMGRYPEVYVDIYVRVDGLTVEVPAQNNGGFYIRAGGHVELLNLHIIGKGYPDVSGAAGYSYGVYIQNAQHILIDNCEIYGTGTDYATRTSISGMSGVNFGKGFRVGIGAHDRTDINDITVTNCKIYGNDVGIAVNGSKWLINRNQIYNCSTDGIDIGYCNETASGLTDPIIITNNHIHHLGWFGDGYSDHCDLIQFTWAESNHIQVRKNIMHDSDQQGIFSPTIDFRDPDYPSHDWLFENNLIYNMLLGGGGGTALRINGTAGIVFRNNTIGPDHRAFTGGDATGGMLLSQQNDSCITEWTSLCNNIIPQIGFSTHDSSCNPVSDPVIYDYENYNILRGLWVCATLPVLGPNDIKIATDAAFKALFNSYDTNDFTLVTGSQAINAGDPNNQPSDSLGSLGPDGFIIDNGPTRDGTHHSIGAYEFQGTVPPECIDNTKLLDYIFQWKQGNITMLVLMQKIAAWKAGTGC